MIPILGDQWPDGPEPLRAQIDAGLRKLGLSPRTIEIEAPLWPSCSSVLLDFTGSNLNDPGKVPHLESRGSAELTVAQLEVRGLPVFVRGLPIDLELHAEAARLGEVHLSGGLRALALDGADRGTLQLGVAITKLEQFAQTLLAELARKHGVDIVGTKLRLMPETPRKLRIEAEVTAKVMLMKAPVTLVGEAALDDALNLHLTNLHLEGGGMAAKLASGFLQPHFERIQKSPIALQALALGEIRLQDVGLAVNGDRLQLRALFGS